MRELFLILKMNHRVIFSILKDKYLSKHSKIHKEKQTSFLAKVNSRCFFPISGRDVARYVGAPQRDTNMASPY